jgi:hypothetical protein
MKKPRPSSGRLALVGTLALLCAAGACSRGPRLEVAVLDASGPEPQPLEGVRVELRGVGPAAADASRDKLTSGSGRVAFGGLPEGLYEVRAGKAGYTAAHAVVRVPEERSARLDLLQVFTLSGRVLLPDGSPAPDAVVLAFDSGGRRRAASVLSGASYRLEQLPPEVYQIHAATADRLYSAVVERLALQGDTVRDLYLEELPPQFEMPSDQPAEVPDSAPDRGRSPKQ